MAWGTVTNGFITANQDKTAGTSIVSGAIGSAGAAIGSVAIIVVAKDNAATADGETSEVTSVTDTKGNVYTKAKEFCNSQGSAAGGATVSLWYSKLTIALVGSVDTVTANFSSSVTASAITGETYTIGAGASVTVEGSATLANDGADPGSMTISGLASREYMFIRCIAYEGVFTTGTTTASYSSWSGHATSGGGGATNMGVWVESRFFTGTTDTSNPTVSAVDSASVYVAFKEATTVVASLMPFNPIHTYLPHLAR